MIDITIQNFESELIQASARAAGAARHLGALVRPVQVARVRCWKSSSATTPARFTLAKLNSRRAARDRRPADRCFGVRSIPFCVLFDQGQPVDGFVGAQPAGKIRQFLDRHVPSAAKTCRPRREAEEGRVRWSRGRRRARALAKLQQAVAVAPATTLPAATT